jgi:signal transduction histidine kinase
MVSSIDGKLFVRLAMSEPVAPVWADGDSIRQVVTNLLSNAIKYSPHGGEVTIGARQEGAEVIVWVADQGIGIPPAALPKLFSKFFRVDNEQTKKIRGTGLGLALVKEIIEEHQGRVWVESELGKGSTFFFSLPVATQFLSESDLLPLAANG